MMTERNDDNADVDVRPASPLRAVFAAAVGTVLDMLPDSYARKVVVEEIMAAERRSQERLIRRYVN